MTLQRAQRCQGKALQPYCHLACVGFLRETLELSEARMLQKPGASSLLTVSTNSAKPFRATTCSSLALSVSPCTVEKGALAQVLSGKQPANLKAERKVSPRSYGDSRPAPSVAPRICHPSNYPARWGEQRQLQRVVHTNLFALLATICLRHAIK